jgi:hypothetical protein
MHRRLLRLVGTVWLATNLAVCVLWLLSYRTPEPTTRVISADGTVEYGSRQGYVYLIVDGPLPQGAGGMIIPVQSRPFPGVEREVLLTPYSGAATRVRWWLVALCTFVPGAVLLRPVITHWRARRWERRGRCSACGYDLRASPGRCPECGTIQADRLVSAVAPRQ